MKNRFDNISDFGQDLMDLVVAYRALQNEAVRLKLTAALLKAYYYDEDDIAKKLEKQLDENRISLIDEYSNYVYRTLDDMRHDGIITDKEYGFCNV
jgi:hypothetical protein